MISTAIQIDCGNDRFAEARFDESLQMPGETMAGTGADQHEPAHILDHADIGDEARVVRTDVERRCQNDVYPVGHRLHVQRGQERFGRAQPVPGKDTDNRDDDAGGSGNNLVEPEARNSGRLCCASLFCARKGSTRAVCGMGHR